ncbi:MAG: type II secretion system protein GspM [Pseudomonadota bacterium]
MPTLLPDENRQKPLAWMLLVVAAILVYWVGFRWYFERQGELNAQIDQLRTSQARFQGLLEQGPVLERELDSVREQQAEADFFFPQDNTSLGSAALTNRLKEIIRAHGSEENCQVISNQNMRVRDKERFQRVTNKVRLRCEVEDLANVFYQLENGTPYVFLDNVSVYRQITRRRQGRETVRQQILDVRFDLSGYLRIPG